MMPIALPTPQLLHIAGPDAVEFTQAQFSSDIAGLANGHWHWSAWLSAQGRVRAFFQLLRLDDENLQIVLRGGSATQIRDALARYVMRAKVQIRTVDNMPTYIIDAPIAGGEVSSLPQGSKIQTDAQGSVIALPGAIPRWLFLARADAANIDAEQSDFAINQNTLADIDAGIVHLDAVLEDRLLPDWIGLGELEATSVRKGCYPGQEVVARLHFKGGNKRWLHRITFDADTLPMPGVAINAVGDHADEPYGLVVNSARLESGKGVALAVLRDTQADASLKLETEHSQIQATRIHPSKH